jgi:hypothetical protein
MLVPFHVGAYSRPFHSFFRRAQFARLVLVLSVALVLSACTTPAPSDYGGGWKPVNRFQDVPTEIPLAPAYTFYASPMDLTLKTMLKRWAADNSLELAYQLNSDYTLYKPVANIRTPDIQAATSALNAIYATQGVFVTTDDKRILVHSGGGASVAQPPANNTPASQSAH